MITKKESFQTEDLYLFASENEAKLHELQLYLQSENVSVPDQEAIMRALGKHIDTTVSILTGSVRVRGKYNRKAKAKEETK